MYLKPGHNPGFRGNLAFIALTFAILDQVNTHLAEWSRLGYGFNIGCFKPNFPGISIHASMVIDLAQVI